MRRSRPNVIAFFQGVASRLKGIRLNATASSLAFTTLLALVPLATVAFAVVSQFPAFETGLATLEEWLVRGLVPGAGAGVVRDSIRQFAEQAARLAPLTVAFLAVTATMLVATIDTALVDLVVTALNRHRKGPHGPPAACHPRMPGLQGPARISQGCAGTRLQG